MNVANIPPSRIVLLGQSLGTAVTTAVALHFASGPATPISNMFPSSSPLPADLADRPSSAVDFAGIVLVAPFTNLPHLVLSYRIKGILPILSPLRPYPYLQNLLSHYIVDKWDSTARLAELVRITTSSSSTSAATPSESETTRRLRIQILHARDDVEISWKQSEALFQAAIDASAEAETNVDTKAYQPKILKKGEGFVEIQRKDDKSEIRLDVVGHGGEFSCVMLILLLLLLLYNIPFHSPFLAFLHQLSLLIIPTLITDCWIANSMAFKRTQRTRFSCTRISGCDESFWHQSIKLNDPEKRRRRRKGSQCRYCTRHCISYDD